MFGFLAPQYRLPAWRRSYARICQHQRRLFGLTALPFLSYEATFLYQLAIDFEIVSGPSGCAPQCCRLRHNTEPESEADRSAATFAAAFGMLLAGVKLDDDVLDSGRWYNRLARWKYGRQIQTAHATINNLAPNVHFRVTTARQQHAHMEQTGIRDLAAYCTPTGDGFAAVFEEFARCYSTGPDTLVDTFSTVGRNIGQAIISWDCAVDFKADQIRGDFNPLRNTSDVSHSLEFCNWQLSQAGWQLPQGCPSAEVILSVANRVRSRRTTPTQHPLTVMERWGLARQHGRTYARCDGCDAICAVGECCECMAGAGEAGTGCAECGSGSACIPDFFCCCDGCGGSPGCKNQSGPCETQTRKRDQQASNPDVPLSAYEWCHGKDAQADNDLQPTGHIIVDGQRIPAKTASGDFMSHGTACRVVRTDAFGVSVEPI